MLQGGKLYEPFLSAGFSLLLYFIKSKINMSFKTVSVWPYPFTVFATAITAFMAQIFLAYRYSSQQRNSVEANMNFIAAEATDL